MSFNWEIYRELNPDLIRAGLRTKQQYDRHYMMYGRREGRKFNISQLYPDFSHDGYRDNNEDLKSMNNEQLELHWFQYGIKEGRNYKNTNKLIISPHLMGGLCNQMFQIASAYGFALKHNKKVVITTIDHNPHSNINYFNNIFRSVDKDSSINITDVYREPGKGALQYNEIPYKNNHMGMFGYFQNEKYFMKYRKEILDLFKIETEREERLKYIYSDLDNSYFIHIRRGDYVNNTFHDIDLTEYYKKCMEYIKSINSNSHFYVFSNDIQYCKGLKWLSGDNIIFIENADEVDNLYLMSMCKLGGIGCNSSFSWWGGYLNKNNDKLVIYPNKWFNSDWVCEIGWSDCYIMDIVNYKLERVYTEKNCIVTAYYNIKSKFPNEKYLEWITNFMNTVLADVVIYTSIDMVEYFKTFNNSNVTILVKDFRDLYYYKYYDVFKKQWDIDHLKDMRSPELFILWYNKLKFVEEASIRYGKRYKNYIWCDIGVFREHNFFQRRKTFGLCDIKSDKPILLQLRDIRESDLKLYDDGIYGNMDIKDVFLGGGIICVPLNYINDIMVLQESVMKRLIGSNRFYGCDQRIYAYMYGERQDMFNLVRPSGNGDPWFYLLDNLSN